MDRADWEQTFLAVHRGYATRILDFPRTVEYLPRAPRATWRPRLPIDQAADPVAARQARKTALNYVAKRLDHIKHARFRANGLPIGSDSVESATFGWLSNLAQ